LKFNLLLIIIWFNWKWCD